MRKMSNLLLLRRSSSSPLHKRLALSALTHLFSSPVVSNPLSSSSLINEDWVSRSALQNPQFHNFTATSSTTKPPAEWPSFGILSRGFHSGRTLQSAGYAVADLPDDNKKYSHKDDDKLEISKLGISNDIVSALAKKNITKLLPIQREVLEPAMQGRDMIGRARTGTGKTLAFGIPILDKIIRFNEKNGRGKDPLALVLAPTRELARQVDREFYESAPSLDTLCVYGGTPIMRQMSTLDRGVDIVVGTPGRVIDLIKRGSLNLSSVKFVVLDEADQMLNVGFAEDVEIILGNIRQEHQTMMFSATMPSWILKITQKFLKNPMHVDLVGDSDQKVAEGISLYSIASEMHQKAAVIGPLITEHAKGGKCIVFTQTKRDADRLAYSIQRNFKCEPLHGDISQNQRERTLSGFRDGRFNVLVATDVAARGLDVPNVDLVIHYELPNSSEIFVHRSGRTGRVGKKGTAILIYSSNQYRDVKSIERDIGSRFTELPRISVEGGSNDMFDDLGRGGDRFDSFGSMGGGRGRSSGYGNSGSGRFGRYGGSSSSRPSGSGGPSSRGGQYGSGGGYGGSNSGQSGSFGGFGSGRTGGFGNQRGSDSVGFGNFGCSDRRGSFGSLGGSSRSSGFGEFGSKRYSGFGNMNSGQNYHSASGDDRTDGNQNPRRKLL